MAGCYDVDSDRAKTNSTPDQGEKMSTNRLFTVLVALALAVVAVFTVYNVSATTALVQADRAYDQVEEMRADRSDANLQADRSYDAIEAQRLESSLTTEDQSYDQVESLRTQRNILASDRSYDQVENLRVMRTFLH